MARVCAIRVYPVKGLDPVEVESARVLPSGAIEDDRRWAFVDERGRFVNGKNYAAIHEIRAEFDLERREVNLDGRAWSLEREQDGLCRWFSERLGCPVSLQENPAAGFPDDTESPGPTLVSRASLEAVGTWFGLEYEAVRRRFRTNIELDELAPFAEDCWYGKELDAGAARLLAVNPCQRCVVPSRDPWSGAALPGFQKRFADLRAASIPPGANSGLFNHYYRLAVNTRLTGEAGTVRVGDSVNEIS